MGPTTDEPRLPPNLPELQISNDLFKPATQSNRTSSWTSQSLKLIVTLRSSILDEISARLWLRPTWLVLRLSLQGQPVLLRQPPGTLRLLGPRTQVTRKGQQPTGQSHNPVAPQPARAISMLQPKALALDSQPYRNPGPRKL